MARALRRRSHAESIRSRPKLPAAWRDSRFRCGTPTTTGTAREDRFARSTCRDREAAIVARAGEAPVEVDRARHVATPDTHAAPQQSISPASRRESTGEASLAQ